MADTLNCPVCGSADIATSTDEQVLKLPFGQPTTYHLTKQECRNCGEVGDFCGQNDELYLTAENQAITGEINSILHSLGELNVSNAYFERALGLPQRTVSRWKSGKCSHSAVALLRMVRTYPWLLKVADAGYESNQAKYCLIENAGALIASSVGKAVISVRVDFELSANISGLEFQFKKTTSPNNVISSSLFGGLAEPSGRGLEIKYDNSFSNPKLLAVR